MGIGVHHAGLTLDDRQAIERLYVGKVLRILIATSVRPIFFFLGGGGCFNILMPVEVQTLAVGVNLREFFMVETWRTNQISLAAHMVIIKGVHTYQNNASKEYSDLDVMQMLGRAGRPQFGFFFFSFYVHLTHQTFRHRWSCCHHVRNTTRIEIQGSGTGKNDS